MTERENVIKTLNDALTAKENYPWAKAEMSFDFIRILITLLKEQEDGRWIVLEYCANEGIYCSKCNNKIFDIATKPKKKLSNFCPNCGSKNTNFFNPSTGKIMYSD